MPGSKPVSRSRAGLGLVLLLVSAAATFAQEGRPGTKTAVEPTYIHPEEVAVLNAQFSAVLKPPGGTAPNPDDLVQLSRLLAEPCDQLRWLLYQAQDWAAQPAQQQAATSITQAALPRGESLAGLGLLKECADALSALQELATRRAPSDELTNPEALRARLQQGEGLTSLDAFTKFALLARGAPAARLFAGSVSEDWDTPRWVLDRLASVVELPTFDQLRELQQRLAATSGLWGGRADPSMSEPAKKELVTASFQIAAALLDRALGLDANDRTALQAPIPYRDDPAEWARLAAALDQETLRSWATLARILAASPPAGGAAPPDLVSGARDTWADVRKVSTDVWPAVDTGENSWLTRLTDAARANSARMLPLGQAFNAGRSEQRRKAEEDVTTTLRGVSNPKDESLADRLFNAIQRAKLAEVGVGTDVKPLDLKALKTVLGGDNNNWVYLFIEMVHLRESGAQTGPAFAGVALYRPEYAKRMADSRYSDRYEIKILPQCGSPDELIRAALAAPGPPLIGGGQIRKDARIMLALDGVLPAAWFSFEQRTLLQPIEWTASDSAWVVYLPSAAVLGSSRWSLDDTLRAWYRSAVRTDHVVPTLSADSTPVGIRRTPGPPLDSRLLGLTIFRVWMDRGAERPEEQFFDLLAAKRAAEIRAIPLWVGKGGGGRS